jgi:CheY-like chemotaxis protein
MSEKVILVHRDAARRNALAFFLEASGYNVHDYADGSSALLDVMKDGHDPFVLAGEFDMGDVFTPDEMKRCLEQHSAKTGVRYGIVAFNTPKQAYARKVLADSRIMHSDDDDSSRLKFLIEAEKARIS